MVKKVGCICWPTLKRTGNLLELPLWSVGRSVGRSIRQSVCQSVSQAISQSVSQSASQSNLVPLKNPADVHGSAYACHGQNVTLRRCSKSLPSPRRHSQRPTFHIAPLSKKTFKRVWFLQ